MGENGFGLNECKIDVRYYDVERKAWRYMYIDVREISSIDHWDDLSEKDGYACICFNDATEIRVSKDSYKYVLPLWLSV